ncbi:unnamed protein product [Thelazia callipaeda]|uniref:Uncharacterized protein n=1 Tax=Thelazia callipaeda TaxID=103827 RepID=A0A3P7K2K5_THECL|nr:unnamed protein product [Thelazia callipaeda]
MQYLALLLIVQECESLIDTRHRFSLKKLPFDLKQQIMNECNSSFVKYYVAARQKLELNAKEKTTCPVEVQNCVLSKTNPFLGKCNIQCEYIGNKAKFNVDCWNDDCLRRFSRVCEDIFWRRIRTSSTEKKKIRCKKELKHCYSLACLKCLGRECTFKCYNKGIRFHQLLDPQWKGFSEYKKYFPEVDDIIQQNTIIEVKEQIDDDDE